MWVMLKHVKDIEWESVDWVSLAHDRVHCRVILDMTVELRVIQKARSYWRSLVTIRGTQILTQRFSSFSLHGHRFQILPLPFMVTTSARRCCRLVFHHPHHTTHPVLTASACRFTACFLFQWRHLHSRANPSTPCLFALNWTTSRYGLGK
jgi:hypothetical protein